MDSPWWLEHKEDIEMAEGRFGRLFPDDETDRHDNRTATGDEPESGEPSGKPLELPALPKESELPGNSIQDFPLREPKQIPPAESAFPIYHLETAIVASLRRSARHYNTFIPSYPNLNEKKPPMSPTQKG
jgi:hypothetical protein